MINAPLAERMRPTTLDEYIGQAHLLAEGAALRRALDAGVIPSMIFWGPPGVGKTTLAQLIAKHLDRPIHTLSAISSGVKDVREVINRVENGGMFQAKGTILFIDEIHRFSKAQQDSLLGAVEKGTITLIGATTENPSFEVISALLSRCQTYVLKEHTREDLLHLLDRAINQDSVLNKKKITLTETNSLLAISGGDARKLLNVFEIIIGTFQGQTEIDITDEVVLQNAQQSLSRYDKDGEQHYDIVSAFIKSIRGSDPNGAVYWLARMIEGGEDVKFIARRMLILSSEDIGNANPTAFIMANNTFQAVSTIGYPESRILLSQCAIYLATSPKSNASYVAINEAQQVVKQTGDLPVPIHLRNAPTKLMKELGYGEDYKYSHDYVNNFAEQEFLPNEISETKLYNPGDNARENSTREFLKNRWKEKYGY